MEFADLISPVDEQRFMEEYFDQAPLHLKADGASINRAKLMGQPDFLDLLEIVPQWQSGRLKMVMDSRPVAPEHYCVSREAAAGPTLRPDRALVEAMMALGASVVADGVEDVSVEIRRCCAMLGRHFAAKAGANIYISHGGVQAFSSHCDPHEVFAVQCEGRKLWRIYGARADRPVQTTLLTDQGLIDRVKGPLVMEAMMEPGDLLYLPRGFYHDALAQEGRSMHVTFAVQPLYAAGVLDMLRDIALDRTTMRAYVGAAQDKQAIAAQLAGIADELALLIKSPAMIEDIAVRQRTMASPIAEADTEPPYLLVRTGVPCSVDQPLEGSTLAVGRERIAAGLLSDAARWIFVQAGFTPAQCRARFCHHPAEEIEALLTALVELGALEKQVIQG